jgi:hypothetical protein
MWRFYAVDNLGNEYTDGGGAYGLAEDGRRTDGVLSLQPTPPAEATSLRISLGPWTDRDPAEDVVCVFEIDLGPAPR